MWARKSIRLARSSTAQRWTAQPVCATCCHQNEPQKLENLTKINTYHAGLVAHLLEKLKATPDGDGNLLDHSPLPVFVAGGAAGRMKGGRHVKNPIDTPRTNLLASVLDKAGIHENAVGDSTGQISDL